MHFENFTRFPEFIFPSVDPKGNWFQTCVVRGTYRISEGSILIPVSQQSGPQLFDEYRGDPRISSLRKEHDRVPAKPRGEVVFVDPVARPISCRPETHWTVTIQVGSIASEFEVSGPRSYQRGLFRRWVLSEPTSTDEVPICYELTFGGSDPNDPTNCWEANPCGRGFPLNQLNEGVSGPQIFALGAVGQQVPFGITPVHRGWSPRRTLAGTIDERWKTTKWPLYPDDFDARFFLQSPEHLQLQYGFFQGGEEVFIRGLGQHREYRFEVPKFAPYILLFTNGQKEDEVIELDLDTLVFNLEQDELSLVWRASFIAPSFAREIYLMEEGVFHE
jgi:hypothetical protein